MSALFAGHPNLIQGFNTFLPPSYRIDCDLENNPWIIRVTTPSGSNNIHSIGRNRAQGEGAQGHGQGFMNQRPGNGQQHLQHSIESPEAQFSAPAQNGPSMFTQVAAQNQPFETSLVHQRAVPAALSAVKTLSTLWNVHTPTPAGPQRTVNSNSAARRADMEKRGPVDFNHAMSYVKKIKVREFYLPVASCGVSIKSFQALPIVLTADDVVILLPETLPR
jgi:paired amphipathic helix protein Sin3a